MDLFADFPFLAMIFTVSLILRNPHISVPLKKEYFYVFFLQGNSLNVVLNQFSDLELKVKGNRCHISIRP